MAELLYLCLDTQSSRDLVGFQQARKMALLAVLATCSNHLIQASNPRQSATMTRNCLPVLLGHYKFAIWKK